MYDSIKSCVKVRNDTSGFFACETGVRQGENLSPFLFSIFLSDLEDYLRDNNVIGLETVSLQCQEQIEKFISLFVLLYADDTIILAESDVELQNALFVFENYCTNWKLSVNVDKTKVIVFSKRKIRRNAKFLLYGSELEIVDSYPYLGLLFNFNGKFTVSKKRLSEQAQKALFALYRKLRNISIPVDLQLKLFDTLIEPILLYACEIWGYENVEILEKIHLQFLKRVLHVRSSTPNFMVYGETGHYPLIIRIKQRMLTFWSNILQSENKLCYTLYQLMFKLQRSENCTFKWMDFLKSIFNDIGLTYVWDGQFSVSKTDIKIFMKQILCDQYIQSWFNSINSSSRGHFYSAFKPEFGLEKYLIKLKIDKRIEISKLRCNNLKFPSETGRWNNIPRHERLCTLCDDRQLGNEFHYICICKHEEISRLRSKFIPRYYTENPREDKLHGLLRYCNVKVLNNLAIFLKKIKVFF